MTRPDATDPASDDAAKWVELGAAQPATAVERWAMDRARARLFGLRGREAIAGRYRIVDETGRGAMGVVFEAVDPALGRRVALKLVSPALLAEHGERAQERLLREARALARVVHPNVVEIFDVDVFHGDVFMAMELVTGRPLREWIGGRPHHWDEVRPVALGIGGALAAIHAAGLVHRDVKPDNILVDPEGRARVVDFGLARDDQSTIESERSSEPNHRALGSASTRSYAGAGTPAYMAPEQHRGAAPDLRCDQYSYCLLLWEALAGRRPFAALTEGELLAAKQLGVAAPVDSTLAPAAVWRALSRGLAPDPADRWSSVDELVRALARRRPASPWRVPTLGAAAIVLVTTASLFVGAHRERDACGDSQARLAGVWDDTVRERVHAALLRSEVPYAEDTWRRVATSLDTYAQRWSAELLDACAAAATTERDARRLCLDMRLRELNALTRTLSQASADVTHSAARLTASLTSVERCRAGGSDAEVVPEDPALAADVEAVRDLLADAKGTRQAGRYAEALAAALVVQARAEQLGFAPLDAEVALELGTTLELSARSVEAETMLRSVYFDATELGLDSVAADAANMLAITSTHRHGRHDEALEWARHAIAAAEKLDDPVRRVGVQNTLGSVHRNRGELSDAEAAHRRALEECEAASLPDYPALGVTVHGLGMVQEARGEYELALESLAWSLAIVEDAVGPEHPSVAENVTNLGEVQYRHGDYAASRESMTRALQIREAAFGPDHVDVAGSLVNLANAHYGLGDYAHVRRMLARALAIEQRVLGVDHPRLAPVLNSLAMVEDASGNHAAAVGYYRSALAILERSLGAEHSNVGLVGVNLATAHRLLGEYDAARTSFERALAVLEKALGPDHPHLAYALTGLGKTLLDDRRPAEAIAPLERAVALREHGDVGLDLLAEARFALARALWDSRRDRTHARALAELARGAYLELPEQSDDAREVDSWLAARDG